MRGNCTVRPLAPPPFPLAHPSLFPFHTLGSEPIHPSEPRAGTIPTEVFHATAITGLKLSHNTLTGTLPSEFGIDASCIELRVAENLLTGSIPSEIGEHHPYLRFVYLNTNSFSGSLPTELGLLTIASKLQIYENSLTGTIPTYLAELTALTKIDFYSNSFTGTIPTELIVLTAMTDCLLYSNIFHAVPSELGVIGSGDETLVHMDISYNSIGGLLPSELASIATLTGFDISYNSFQGSLPSQIAVMSSLTALTLSGNQFCGFYADVADSSITVTGASSNDNMGQTCGYGFLTELYGNTAGDSTWLSKSGWMSGDPCTSGWYGVTCSAEDLTSLTLNANDIEGSMPSEVRGLTRARLRGAVPHICGSSRLPVASRPHSLLGPCGMYLTVLPGAVSCVMVDRLASSRR